MTNVPEVADTDLRVVRAGDAVHPEQYRADRLLLALVQDLAVSAFRIVSSPKDGMTIRTDRIQPSAQKALTEMSWTVA